VRIIIIGMKHVGKSTIARHLSEHLRRPLIDLDEELVRAASKEIKRPLAGARDVFENLGRERFRSLELSCLWETLSRSDTGRAVMALGGGALDVLPNDVGGVSPGALQPPDVGTPEVGAPEVGAPDTRDRDSKTASADPTNPGRAVRAALLSGENAIVYLREDIARLWERVEARGTPAYITGSDPVMEFRRIAEDRDLRFRNFADVVVELHGASVPTAVELVREALARDGFLDTGSSFRRG
jgi:shikimate kinase